MKRDPEDLHKLVSIFYEKYYNKTFNNGGISSWAYKKTHKDLEKHFSEGSVGKILEIGAGTLQHLEFIKQNFLEYIAVDLLEKPTNLKDKRVKWIQADIENLQFENNHFDRIISMCVFHHLSNPDKVMKLIDCWLRPGGTFSLFLPLDPSFANRLNRKLVVTPKVRKLGFQEYELVNAVEHKNHFWSLKVMLEYFFHDYEKIIRYEPFISNIPLLNLYSIWHIKKPKN